MLARIGVSLALAAALGAACSSARSDQAAVRAGGDWTRFGYDAARHNSGPSSTGITAANIRRMSRQRVGLGGTVDSSPIYLRGASVRGGTHDAFFVTTTYGKTFAIDADSGGILWAFTPAGYGSWVGSYRITNATPLADPSRRYVYSISPDGILHKLSVASGAQVWSTAVTRYPVREKVAPALNYSRGLVLVGTGGYLGDAPPYQGHVVAVDAGTGHIVHVWNSLCSDQHALLVPSRCAESDSAIWGRAGVVVVPATGDLLVATGNGRFDGRRYWGDSVLLLTPNASRLLRNWTPRNQAALNSGDVDIGSTAPVLLTSRLVVQSGKDGKLRLLRLPSLGGRLGRTGGELQTISAPGGSGVFTAPAVWQGRLFVATNSGTSCFRLVRGRLTVSWRRKTAGTSPVVAGGLLYVYDPNGGLNVYRPTTGSLVARLSAGGGHWNSPIVTDGRIALPEGDANDHRTSGILDIWRVR
ncbi:MAG: PQQ-binding-like beta-propeller repeat protein [Gaiellaceae bacterium]